MLRILRRRNAAEEKAHNHLNVMNCLKVGTYPHRNSNQKVFETSDFNNNFNDHNWKTANGPSWPSVSITKQMSCMQTSQVRCLYYPIRSEANQIRSINQCTLDWRSSSKASGRAGIAGG